LLEGCWFKLYCLVSLPSGMNTHPHALKPSILPAPRTSGEHLFLIVLIMALLAID